MVGNGNLSCGPPPLKRSTRRSLSNDLPGLSGRVTRAYFGLDLRIPFVACGLEIILGLHVDPIVRRGVEIASQTQGSLPSNPSLAGYNTGNPVSRHMQRLGQAVHANSQIRQGFFEDFSGVNGR